MGYYFIKEKRTTLDASEMSEGESSLLALGTIGIVFLIILAYVSVFVAVALITVNMGALFRNHGKKFVLCLVPFYNLYLCSKLLVKNGWILWGILITLPVMLGCVSGGFSIFTEFPIGNIILFCIVLILNFVLTGYFNYQISKITGAVGKGYALRKFLDCFPIVSGITLAIFLVKDMGKY